MAELRKSNRLVNGFIACGDARSAIDKPIRFAKMRP
jgi:hypothetical protein